MTQKWKKRENLCHHGPCIQVWGGRQEHINHKQILSNSFKCYEENKTWERFKKGEVREGATLGSIVKKCSYFTFKQNLNNVYYHEDLEEKALMAEGAESTNS